MGFFTPPPTEGGSYPDIPVPNFKEAAKQAAAGLMDGGIIDDTIVKAWHYFKEAVFAVLVWSADKIDRVAAFFVEALTHAQGVGQPGMMDMMAAVLGDLLGIEYNPDELRNTMTKGGRIKAMTKAGGWLFDTLRSEFDPSGGTAQQQASDMPARSFLGFLIEFAVRQGNLSYFAEFIPAEFNFFLGLREYGELLARNLGLGRLARQALRPLMQVMVADPLLWKLNSIYRPKLLSAAQAIKAYKRGALPREELNRILSYEGYSDSAIELLIADTAKVWHARELLELVRLGKIDELEAVDRLTNEGLDDETADQLWTAYKGESAQGLVRLYITELLREVRNGYLGDVVGGKYTVDVDTLLAPLPLTTDELNRWKHIFGQFVEVPRKHLSESEIERAFLGGILDMTTVQDFWIRLGYSPGSVQVLTFLLLQKQSGTNRTTSGHVPHKVLTEAQAEKAYKAGIIGLPQLQAYWVAQGYSPTDQAVLTALVTLSDTSGPTPPV